MKTRSLLQISLIALALTFLALNCNKKEDDKPQTALGQVQFSTQAYIQTDRPVFERDTFAINSERDFVLQKFKLYLSNVYLVDENGGRELLIDILLADVGDEVTGGFSAQVKTGRYVALEMGLGLDSIQNDKNPEDFPRDHPLSSWNQMYWSMLKYRFVILEGRSAATGQLGGMDDMLHAYHPGTDPLYHVISRPIDLLVSENGQSQLELAVHLDQIFSHGEGIDLLTEPQTHSEPVDIHVAIKFMDHLAATVEVK